MRCSSATSVCDLVEKVFLSSSSLDSDLARYFDDAASLHRFCVISKSIFTLGDACGLSKLNSRLPLLDSMFFGSITATGLGSQFDFTRLWVGLDTYLGDGLFVPMLFLRVCLKSSTFGLSPADFN